MISVRGVVTLAGDGSRMLPWTQGLRKEFLPLFDRSAVPGAPPVLKPVAVLAVETLAGAGIENLTLVVRPENRAFVRGYFAVDPALLRRHAHQPERLRETRRFYRTLARLTIRFAIQPEPLGFGDAVLRAGRSVGDRPFVLHAGDGALIEPERGAIVRTMARLREREDLDAVLLVRRVADPRRYGVIEGSSTRPFAGMRRIEVRAMVEKPARPRSHWAATAVYAFGPALWRNLRACARRPRPGEFEVTDGIDAILAGGGRIAALVLDPRIGWWKSVGSPEGYAAALQVSRARALRPRSNRGKERD